MNGCKCISEMLGDNGWEIVEALVSVFVVKIAEGGEGHVCLRDQGIGVSSKLSTA